MLEIKQQKPDTRTQLAYGTHMLPPGWSRTIHPAFSAILEGRSKQPTVYIVDHDPGSRAALGRTFAANDFLVDEFSDLAGFLGNYQPNRSSCLLVDVLLLGMEGFDLIQRMKAGAHALPTVVMASSPSLAMAVQAVRAGAVDFLDKKLRAETFVVPLLRAIKEADQDTPRMPQGRATVQQTYKLTDREHQVLNLILAGHASKNIAFDLSISQRTVENHRASIAKKTGSKSLAAMIRKVLCTECLQHNPRQADTQIAH